MEGMSVTVPTEELTHNSHNSTFRGCETANTVFLTKWWGRGGAASGSQVRSGPTRAVSQLCIVTGDLDINPEELKQDFAVIEM